MKLAILAFSRQGCRTALRIARALEPVAEERRLFTMAQYIGEGAFQAIAPPVSRFTGPLFAWADALVFVGACGIAVRAIAPYVRDKRTDPAVLVVDELGGFAISLLSGHIGGANDLAERVAEALGATAVVTTATDVNRKFSVDAWAARSGCAISNMGIAKDVSAAILEGPVPLCSDLPIATDLPPGTVPGDKGPLGICISWRRRRPFDRTLLLTPRVLHLGIGCRRGTATDDIRQLVDDVLTEHQLSPAAVKLVASIDLKREEPGLLEFCREKGWTAQFYTAAELAELEGDFTPSEFVRGVTGVDNVCERAALLGAGRLLVRKTARCGVTVAVAAEDWEVRFG